MSQTQLCPNCRAKLEPFKAQSLTTKAGIVILTAALLGLAVLVTGWIWHAAIEVWS